MTRPGEASVGGHGPPDDVARVLAANAAFYEAFEQCDFDAMSDAWERGDRAQCTHPGWPTLRGWGAIASSWVTLLSNSERLQFILTNVVAVVHGDVGWVTCDENILAGPASSTVAAINVFVRDDFSPEVWRLVSHHGSVVHASLTG